MEIDNHLLPLIIVLGCLSGVLLVVLICLLVYFCYVVYRDKEIARREAAYIEEEPEHEAGDDDLEADDPLYEHICTVVDANRDKDGGEDDRQIHSNGHVTVDIENGVDGGVGISFDPAFQADGQRNSRVIISDNGVYSSIDRDDVGTEAAETETTRPSTSPAPAAVDTKASVYEDIDSVRRHPSRNNSTDRDDDDVSTDGSESCTNEHGEPIYSKPDMSKKLNRQSTAPETDASVSLSQSTDSAIAECDDTPPSLPKKSDDLME